MSLSSRNLHNNILQTIHSPSSFTLFTFCFLETWTALSLEIPKPAGRRKKGENWEDERLGSEPPVVGFGFQDRGPALGCDRDGQRRLYKRVELRHQHGHNPGGLAVRADQRSRAQLDTAVREELQAEVCRRDAGAGGHDGVEEACAQADTCGSVRVGGWGLLSHGVPDLPRRLRGRGEDPCTPQVQPRVPCPVHRPVARLPLVLPQLPPLSPRADTAASTVGEQAWPRSSGGCCE